jgi:hypothetical protein
MCGDGLASFGTANIGGSQFVPIFATFMSLILEVIGCNMTKVLAEMTAQN